MVVLMSNVISRSVPASDPVTTTHFPVFATRSHQRAATIDARAVSDTLSAIDLLLDEPTVHRAKTRTVMPADAMRWIPTGWVAIKRRHSTALLVDAHAAQSCKR